MQKLLARPRKAKMAARKKSKKDYEQLVAEMAPAALVAETQFRMSRLEAALKKRLGY